MLENNQSAKGHLFWVFFSCPQEAENILRLMQNKLKEEENRLLKSAGKVILFTQRRLCCTYIRLEKCACAFDLFSKGNSLNFSIFYLTHSRAQETALDHITLKAHLVSMPTRRLFSPVQMIQLSFNYI